MYYLVVNNLFLCFVIITTLNINGSLCDEDIPDEYDFHEPVEENAPPEETFNVEKLFSFEVPILDVEDDQEIVQRRLNNVILYGIPEDPSHSENMGSLVSKIENGFNVSLANDVYACYRLPVREPLPSGIPLLIKFFDNSHKVNFIQRVKKVRATAANFGGSPDVRVYANEHLSKYMSSIYREALRLRQPAKVRFVWSRDGCVFVRQDIGRPPIQIKTLRQLYETFKVPPSQFMINMLRNNKFQTFRPHRTNEPDY